MRKISKHLLMIPLILFSQQALSCTDFRITAKDGTVLITRSMEFSVDTQSNLRSAAKNKAFSNTAPDGKPALSWKSKFGYVYADGLNVALAVDGLNEKGLSFEYLYLPNETQYQKVPAGKNAQGISYLHLGDWILGNFETVDEVRSALANVFIYEQKIPELGDTVLPLHAAVFDASGKGIVVEFVDGKMYIHENKVGILTNSPTYDWHIANLRNYVNLSPYNPKALTTQGITFIATGQGSGMVGLPGDSSPPSRFVKAFVLAETALPVNNALEALNLGQHIINNVDIPRGLVRAKNGAEDQVETTQWVVFKDLTHKKFYYRTYDNMTVREIALKDVDFTEKAPELKMPMKGGAPIVDVTKAFIKSS